MARPRFACRCTLLVLLLLPWLVISSTGEDIDRENAFVGYSEGGQQGECADASPFCSDWAANGECEVNSGYMHESCRKSCGRCGAQAGEGEIGCVGCDVVRLVTAYGDIPIKVRTDWSPVTAGAVLAAARRRGSGAPGNFYRSEKLPLPGAIDNFGGPGPPYALLQGQINGLPKLAREHDPVVERGMVCLIGEGPAFFIAVAAHHEWGHGHTVWGQVEDMNTVDFIVNTLPIKEEVWGQTHVTVLEEKIGFEMELE
eukprot:jgi/Tetstr1/438664/TSEL_027214.t1